MSMYNQGSAALITARFFVGSTPTDPTSVTFIVKAPNGTITHYVYGVDSNVVRVSAGVYTCQLEAFTHEDVGAWIYKAYGTGAVVAGSNDNTMIVHPSACVLS